MANNTGNPVGSTAAKDLSDNAENLDKFANGEDYEYDDRLGRSRKSLKWIEDAALAIPAIDAALRSEQQAERSEAEADRARTAQSEAETARDAAQLSAGVYVDTVAGLANTASGSYFSVPSPEASEFLILYKNVAGMAQEIDRYPNTEKVARLSSMLGQSEEVSIFSVVDPEGFAGFDVSPDRIQTKNTSLSINGVRFGAQSMAQTSDYAFALVDELGYVGFVVPNEGVVSEGEVTTSIKEIIARLNQTALASSHSMASAYNAVVARPIWDYNHFIGYGQSLNEGQEGYPAQSKVARHGNLMLGDAPRPLSQDKPVFEPVGGVFQLKPLVAVVQELGTGAVMTDAAVAALPVGAQNIGENPLVGMVNFAKLLHNQRWMLANDTSRTFVGSVCGVGGRIIESLSKGASPELYQRYLGAVNGVHGVAVAESKSYGVVAINFLQGEYNYSMGDGTKAGYKALLSKLHSDMVTDALSISGQTAPPVFITYQTGGSYSSDVNGLAIGMAQLELAEERENWVMATPVYPYTDKYGHMDSNGYRWIGKQHAKVWNRVVELGQDWKPLSPLEIVVEGKDVLIGFHVPCPPLVFGKPYVGLVATDYPKKGFEILVDGTPVSVVSVEIVADCVVKISLAVEPESANVEVRYAGKTAYNGNGCLHDSDSTVSDDNYEYKADSGQYPAANIPELVGKPYLLQNWCVAFQRPASK
ncbi:hypothetical protein ACIPV9_11415 [Pseudomonas psychrophila]|uniref:hypothetical protein n=1 Tax=Pseudomonas psychrophila TaxID=122355 RepID=UPI003825605F